jgi:hypothetical protein
MFAKVSGFKTPAFVLTHGQVLWVLARGVPPDRQLIDQVRYLRLLGVPFKKSELGGHYSRVRYGFEHLIELGLGVFAIRRGMKPGEVADFLIKNRNSFRGLYVRALKEQPPNAIPAAWAKSRGRKIPILENEIFIRLHDRYAETPGRIEVIAPEKAQDLNEIFALGESYPGEQSRTLVPLTRLILELATWAGEAPEIRPGP